MTSNGDRLKPSTEAVQSSNPQETFVPISVVIPTYKREEQIIAIINILLKCHPQPAEYLIHVDAGQSQTVDHLRRAFPKIPILGSSTQVGPGGGRDRLIRAASSDWVATFDDDSFPADPDYFKRVMECVGNYPHTAVFSSRFWPEEKQTSPVYEAAVFSGCGCIYNREWYLKTEGYVPRKVAYGMEEVDLSLQLHALGGKILLCPSLNVIHDHPITGRFSREVVAGGVVNAFLLPWVRYPFRLWGLGLLQGAKYVLATSLKGEALGVLKGLIDLPGELLRYWRFRRPVSAKAVLSWLALRRRQWAQNVAN